ncbi:MAG: NAD(P)/FAD-dependent oxidoreductase [Marmoricola sp.]
MRDAIVIGGGPAGLQAALTLGRMHRTTLLLDAGSYRNDPADAMHNFLTRDGTDPADLRAAARTELAAYADVEVRDLAATQVSGSAGDFTVLLVDGTEERAASVLLATGVRDRLPDIPGLPELFGSVVAHCPFCHGHEYAGGRVVLADGPHASALAAMMAPVARETVIARAEVVGLRSGGAGVLVALADGTEIDAAGFFVPTSFEQSAPFAEQLGLELLESGCVRVDAFGRTSVPGVYAAGDLAHTAELPMPMASVLSAAAAGLMAGASIVRDGVVAALPS